MVYKGKILIAREENVVTAVNVNVSPISRQRLTTERVSIHAGAAAICVFEYPAPISIKDAREKGAPTTPYLFLIYGDRVWEANPHSYGMIHTSTEPLRDRTVCFTGEDRSTREYWKAFVEAYGGTYVSGVSSNTSFLVAVDKDTKSTKGRSAKRLRVPIMTYEEFDLMIKTA